jgi:outer membrane protein assembly factor BamE (lipoprotein component of BamABCDE complex)
MSAAKGFIVMAALFALGACAVDPGVRPFWTLHETEFRKLKQGMTKSDVEALLGKPIVVSAFPRLEEEVWDYRYMDVQLRMYATLHFDSQGTLKYHSERLDPAYSRGGKGR